MLHQPVLLNEVLAGLALREGGCFIDATFGRGGHARAILQRIGPAGKLLAIDKDPAAVEAGLLEQREYSQLLVEQGTFAMLGQFAERHGLKGKVDGVLIDLGVSSPQLDDAERGFSFLRDGPLDMRMDPGQGQDAATWLAHVDETTLVQVFKTYGEERFAKRIAHAIVQRRVEQPFTRTLDLAAVIKEAHPAWEKHKHPATRCFQAIRIAVNNELDDLNDGLTQSIEVLKKGGRLAVISFHSLEDRRVKQFIRAESQADQLPLDLPIATAGQEGTLRKIGKAIKASQEEVDNNPRARSAILRVAEKMR